MPEQQPTAAAKLAEIPMDELLAHRAASVEDIKLCRVEMCIGVQCLSLRTRIVGNQVCIDMIDAEIARRRAVAKAEGK